MSADTDSAASAAEASAASAGIERGTYEIIRDRLLAQAGTLGSRASALNEKRIELFGGTELTVIGNERIRTENNCVPRDIASVGDALLFGYNVFLGLRTEIRIEDVLSVHRFEETDPGFRFAEIKDHPLVSNPDFQKEFAELYQYYKEARLSAIRCVGARILAVFQVGNRVEDIRVFRWSVDHNGAVQYIDNRGERDHTYPPSHDFEWTITTREDHITGVHPHVSILDEVFVETVGGDLTVKLEDNTATGEGIYAEPVVDPDQSLDDGQIHFASVGHLILIRVLPYREEEWRYLVYNRLTHQVHRIDNIGQACVQLPEDHGIIFPGGYYLQRGETRTFDQAPAGMLFNRMIRSPNGEDVLYVFSKPDEGRSVLLPYNLIRKEVQNPIECHGYSLFPDGKMIVFRAVSDDPTRVHPMQIWQTPFMSDEYAAKQPTGGTFLENVGNADLVRGISDCLSIRKLLADQQPTRQIYEDIIRECQRVMDAYYWLGRSEVGNLLEVLTEIQRTADLIVDEFVKVQTLRSQAVDALSEVDRSLDALFKSLRPDFWRDIDTFVTALKDLRRGRGELITLRDVRYVDLARVEQLESQVVEWADRVGRKAVEFLLGAKALAPFHEKVNKLDAKIEAVTKVTDTAPLAERLDELTASVDLLTEVVGSLEIGDATQRTQILQGISEVMSLTNRTRALLMARRKELMAAEGVAEFGVQFALFGQSVTSALSMSDTPEGCDEQLSRVMLQLEELEGRFSEFDEFLGQLATKREEVYEAFNSKKQMLLDQRQRRAQNLMGAAQRILTGVARKAATLEEPRDLNAYFAADAMVHKVRDISEKLRALGDSVKADEVESQLKSSREDALRGLRDRQEIFEEGGAVIALGKHRFSVNTQPLDLTMVPREGRMWLHLTGTDFHEVLDDPEFEAARPYWDQLIVSETPEVYRAEFERARADGLPIAMHCAGTRKEVDRIRQVKVLEQEDLLDDDLLLAHGNWLSAEEHAICAEHGIGVSVSPLAELRLAMGFPQIREMRHAGVTVSLSLDTTAIAANADPFNQMRIALGLENVRHEDANALTPREAIRIATLDGAVSLGLGHITGSLTPGKRADVVLVRVDQLNTAPSIDPAVAIVHSAAPANVDTVLVDGRIIMHGGRLMTADRDAVVDEAEARLAALTERAGFTTSMAPPSASTT